MRIENDQLKNFIKDSEIIKPELLEAAYLEAQEKKIKLGDLLVEKKLVDEAQLRKLYAYIVGVPYVDLTKDNIPANSFY